MVRHYDSNLQSIDNSYTISFHWCLAAKRCKTKISKLLFFSPHGLHLEILHVLRAPWIHSHDPCNK